jgi:molybdopterin-binding protein
VAALAKETDRIRSDPGERRRAMKISARNYLKGRVQAVTHGMVNTEVIIELPGGIEITSVITKQSAEKLQLSKGKEAYAVIKASNVMIAVE